MKHLLLMSVATLFATAAFGELGSTSIYVQPEPVRIKSKHTFNDLKLRGVTAKDFFETKAYRDFIERSCYRGIVGNGSC